jgi:hypothetical protein
MDMIRDIDALVSSYEQGTLTRRQLLYALAMIATPVVVTAQTTSGSLMKGRNLHHVNVRVSDIARSEAFYRNLFGFSSLHPGGCKGRTTMDLICQVEG